MDTFLILGICFLCYEMCDLIRRYSTPPVSDPQGLETVSPLSSESTSTISLSSSSSEIYTISQNL